MMTLFRLFSLIIFVGPLSVTLVRANVVEMDTLPDHLIMPCTREVPISQTTKVIVPMMPWRGVNLIFPFDLDANETSYTLSGSNLWKYKSALNNKNIVPIYFTRFKNEWGAVQDFTISHQDHVFSIALHAVRDPTKHCTNIQFTLSEAENKRIEATNKKAYQDTLKRQYAQKYAELDKMAEEKALLLVANLAQHNGNRQRIKEENFVLLPNGDDAVVYVKDMMVYGKFSTLNFDIENNSTRYPIYIESIKLLKDLVKTEIRGVVELPKKIPMDTQKTLVFVTRKQLPDTGLTLVVTTDQGEIKVAW